MFWNDTACNLASLNLMQFRKEDLGGKKSFDIRLSSMRYGCGPSCSRFPSDGAVSFQRDRAAFVRLPHAGPGLRQYRRASDGAGIPYDSREGRAIAGAITAILTGISYATSAEMAGELGAFPRFADNRDSMLRVIRIIARRP